MSSEFRDPLISMSNDILEQSRQIAFEVEFFKCLLKVDPTNVRVLVALAENYSILGSYEHSLPIDLQLTQLRPERSVFWYNLACSYARLKSFDSAFAALEKAVARGYDDVIHLIKDPDLKSLRSDPRFAVILRCCKKRRLEARLEACRPDPEAKD
jgi:tetratricopeptide (TPR) repeat protein